MTYNYDIYLIGDPIQNLNQPFLWQTSENIFRMEPEQFLSNMKPVQAPFWKSFYFVKAAASQA